MTLDDPTTTAVESAVLGKAPEQVLANFKRSVRKAVLTVAPKPAEERHVEAVKQRRVVRTPVADGMSEIWMLLPDTGATTFMTAVDALARRVPCGDDDRTADQRRADAVVQLALNTLHGSVSDELPREHGLRPSVQVTVALVDTAGVGRAARRARRLRTDPGLGRPADRRRPDRHLAPAGHRRTRPPDRLRPHHLPSAQRPGRPCDRPRPHLPLPKLQPPSPTLRPRTRHPLGRGRRDQRGQLQRHLQPPPPPTPNTKPAGNPTDNPTAPSNGPHPPGIVTAKNPRPTRSTTPPTLTT